MKNIKNLLVMFLMSSITIFAHNDICISNTYGAAVGINLTWKHNSFPYMNKYQEFLIPINQKNFVIEGLSDEYQLESIKVSPVKNGKIQQSEDSYVNGKNMTIAGGVILGGIVGNLAAMPIMLINSALMFDSSSQDTGMVIESALIAIGAILGGFTGNGIASVFIPSKTKKLNEITNDDYSHFIIALQDYQLSIQGYKSVEHYSIDLENKF